MSNARPRPSSARPVIEAAEEIGVELLLAWIVEGPDRPPDSVEELEAWAAGDTGADGPARPS